jgi:hypothetical protein
MHSRKTSALAPSSTPTPRERELESLLAQSQAQRQAAENKVDNMSAELEELTGSLFMQANKMVAEERQRLEGRREGERECVVERKKGGKEKGLLPGTCRKPLPYGRNPQIFLRSTPPFHEKPSTKQYQISPSEEDFGMGKGVGSIRFNLIQFDSI